jgi:hypothetical protein
VEESSTAAPSIAPAGQHIAVAETITHSRQYLLMKYNICAAFWMG